jgi:hypothetical protein
LGQGIFKPKSNSFLCHWFAGMQADIDSAAFKSVFKLMSRLSSCFHAKIASGKKICLFAAFFFLFHFYLLKTTEVALPRSVPSQLPEDKGSGAQREWPL